MDCPKCGVTHPRVHSQAEPFRVNRVNLALSVIAYFVAALFGVLVVALALIAWWTA